MNPNITPEFIILITIIFLLLLYIFRQYRIIGKLEYVLKVKENCLSTKNKFISENGHGLEYFEWIKSYTKNRIKEIEPSE